MLQVGIVGEDSVSHLHALLCSASTEQSEGREK